MIRANEIDSREVKHSRVIMLFGSIGALLVGLGVIAFFAANVLPVGRLVRTALSAVPIMLCGVAALAAGRSRTLSGWAAAGQVMAVFYALPSLWFGRGFISGGGLDGASWGARSTIRSPTKSRRDAQTREVGPQADFREGEMTMRASIS